MDEDIVAMARAAQRDERLSDGALYGKLADEIEALREVRRASINYASGYLLDEMTDPQMCVSEEQFKAAQRLADALGMRLS